MVFSMAPPSRPGHIRLPSSDSERGRVAKTRLRILLQAAVLLGCATIPLYMHFGSQRLPNLQKEQKPRTTFDGRTFPPLNVSDVAIRSRGFILPEKKPDGYTAKSAHWVSLAEGYLPGDIVAAWVAGTWEGRDDSAIYVAQFSSQTQTWTHPLLVDAAYRHRSADASPGLWYPVLCRVPKPNQPTKLGKLLLIYKSGRSVLDWQSLQTVSEDGGYTWSAPAVQNFTGGVQGVGPFHACQVMQGVNNSQTILAASRSISAVAMGIHMEYSKDGGATWTRSRPIEFEGVVSNPTLFRDRTGAVRLMAQHRAVARQSSRIASYAVLAAGDRSGMRWSAMKEVRLPSPDSPLDTVQLRDGRILAVYNHFATIGIGGRLAINVALSYDDGRTWRLVMTLDHDLEDIGREFANPAVLQTSDGLVHISYIHSTMRTVPGKMAGRENIRHVVLHPEQLDTEYHSKLAEAGWPVSGPSDLVTARELRFDLQARIQEPAADIRRQESASKITLQFRDGRSPAPNAQTEPLKKPQQQRTQRSKHFVGEASKEEKLEVYQLGIEAAAQSVMELLSRGITVATGLGAVPRLEAQEVIWDDDVTDVEIPGEVIA